MLMHVLVHVHHLHQIQIAKVDMMQHCRRGQEVTQHYLHVRSTNAVTSFELLSTATTHIQLQKTVMDKNLTPVLQV